MLNQARKQQERTKGNREFPKENYVNRHTRSILKKSEPDPRTREVQLRLVHPTKSVQTINVEVYKLEREIRRFEGDGFKVYHNN